METHQAGTLAPGSPGSSHLPQLILVRLHFDDMN